VSDEVDVEHGSDAQDRDEATVQVAPREGDAGVDLGLQLAGARVRLVPPVRGITPR